MSRRSVLGLLAFGLLLPLEGGHASADAIRSPPECPEPGWVARRVGHGGWCFPRTCQTDADCAGGGSCEAVRRCWYDSTYSAGRRRFRPDEPRPTRAKPAERCEDGSCSRGDATCRPPAQECVYGPEFSRRPVWQRGDETPPPERVDGEPVEPPPAMTEAPMSEPPAMDEAPATRTAPTRVATSSESDEGGCSAAAGSTGALLFAVVLIALRRRG